MGCWKVNHRYGISDRTVHGVVLRSSELISGGSEKENQIAGPFKVHGNRLAGIRNRADYREQ